MLCFCSLQIILFNAICTADEFFGDHFVESGYLFFDNNSWIVVIPWIGNQ